jgi:hypothetical protein
MIGITPAPPRRTEERLHHLFPSKKQKDLNDQRLRILLYYASSEWRSSSFRINLS